jgi:ABC-type glutathione transport system ATPase component
VADFSTRIERGDRIGIVGPNGSGKTTLVNLLTGALAPDAGTVKLGANLAMATLDQHRESLNPDWTVSEALTGGRGDTVMIGGQAKHVVGYLKDFLFAPEQVRTPLRVLSGGERGRLMLARALAKPSNLLVLDEPTNDLDLETLDVLEEMIGDYAGTVLLISHDRDFLDRVVNAVLIPEGNGKWVEYAGGYSDMLAQRGDECASPRQSPPPRRPSRKLSGQPPTRRGASSTSTKSMRWKRCRTVWPRSKPRSGGCRTSSPIPSFTSATAPPSTRPRWRSPPPRRSCPPPRSAGSNWSCCAARSRDRDLDAAILGAGLLPPRLRPVFGEGRGGVLSFFLRPPMPANPTRPRFRSATLPEVGRSRGGIWRDDSGVPID